MVPTKISLIALILSSGASAAIRPIQDLVLDNEVIAPDGFRRPAVVVNGSFPAPLLTAWKGDTVRFNVIDKLAQHLMNKTTTIHWHGIFQQHTNWADGAAMVSQCPIASGHSFLYDFSTGQQAGTFWYHSHLKQQYCDGLRGPLVVYDPEDPHRHLYDHDDENTVITLSDWYHTPANIDQRFPQQCSNREFNSTLINGRGRWIGDPTAELAVITVEYGHRYRFRLVSMSCDPDYVFQIDEHNLTVIEADGQNTEPLTVDAIDIFAGQRYSFVLDANKPVRPGVTGNYWIRANPGFGPNNFTGFINSAILRYVGASNEFPRTEWNQRPRMLNESDLHALEDPKAPGKPSQNPDAVNVTVNLNFTKVGDSYFVNGHSFVPPPLPVLLQILHHQTDPRKLLPYGSVIGLPRNASVQVTMPGGVDDIPHPLHLHGHAFSVVRSAESTSYNYDNPVRRDTVNTGFDGDNVTIRFETDNPGPWFLHCHIDSHLNAGFAIVFAEDTNTTQYEKPPQSWDELCPIYDRLPEKDH
ncbi:laccase [Gelatoporia subvermispora B]|uniref:laccase n=1 Tax=Ceriporiopsis subvermispora (strain B) TaxID=914234 RepID=M2R2P1_CERS8|nr:laccase [Gelatoporia subvermispora B]